MDSDRARDAFEDHTPLERARDALAAALRPKSWPEDSGVLYARAAQVAVVAQAEAAHRQADALERIADVLDPASPTVNDPADTLPAPWLSIFPVAADGTVLITNTVSGSKVLNLGDDYGATFPGWRMKITWEPTR